MLVTLDAGHGIQPDRDFDPGCFNATRMLCEHDLAMFTAGLIYEALVIQGIKAHVVTGPSLLRDRAASYGRFFVSIHFNAFDGKTQGTEVLVANNYRSEELAFAQKLSHRLAFINKLPNRGAKEQDLAVLRNRNKRTIGILVEPFFLDCVGVGDAYLMASRAAFCISETLIQEFKKGPVDE